MALHLVPAARAVQDAVPQLMLIACNGIADYESLKELKKERNIAEDELVLKLGDFSSALRDFSVMLSDESDFYSGERGKKH